MSSRSYYFVVGARSGSTRLPGKNALEIFGEPLYLRAVRQGVEALERFHTPVRNGYGCVLFTSDCEEWLAAVEAMNDEDVSPVLRPPLLCGVPSINFVRHALQSLSNDLGFSPDDAVILLQPTSPFRTVAGIVEAVREWETWRVNELASFASNDARVPSLVAGEYRIGPPYRSVVTFGRAEDWVGEQVLVPNGALYVARMADVWGTLDPFNDGPRRAWKAPPLWDIDIDTPEDWARAKEIEAMLKSEAGRVA